MRFVGYIFAILIASCGKDNLKPDTSSIDNASNAKEATVSAVTANYYVDNVSGNDSNNGTSATTAWKTVGKVNSVTFKPGNRILFKAGGSWTRQLRPKGSGNSGSPIIIGRYGSGNKPKINGAGVADGALYLLNQQYWEISDLDITNFNTSEAGGASISQWETANTANYANMVRPPQYANKASAKIGVLVAGQDKGMLNHIYLRNLEVHGVNGFIDQSDENSKYNGGVCFRITGTATPTWFNDILVDSCFIHDVDRTGLWTESTWSTRTLTSNTNWTPSLNIIVRNNSFANTGANAMIIRVADRPLMEHNLFDHCAIKASGNAAFNFNTDNAIWQYNESRFTKANIDDDDAGGIDADYRTKNTIIQYNYLHDNDYGMLVTGGSNSFNDKTVVRYNIFKKDGKYAHPVSGKFMIKLSGTASNTVFYNNVVDIGPTQTNTQFVRFQIWGGWPSNTSFYNNIFDNYGSGTSYTFGSSTGNIFDYNCYYKNQVVNQPGQTHNIAGDVKFLNSASDTPDGFKLKAGSVALSSGRVISNNGGKDFFGNPLSATAKPNIGFYQGPGL
ncbi:hypothetical protein GS399_09875 [Pedobacter sp. HMF7647]|uniref:Right-handed parallel beta-helix repeat-containing protein n=1 Tax=Hufsiella arboris TaxID=2695275 RepID=A0A7K1Y9K9_9SPHI|nr:hypothetical protein [Hufsiella arboris]MXV51276.1 hypothetical protein [Hufsiella arboris]